MFCLAKQTVFLSELLSEQYVTVESGTHLMSLHITRAMGEINFEFQSGQKSASPEMKLRKINSLFILDNYWYEKKILKSHLVTN